jgi:hypothetical protein
MALRHQLLRQGDLTGEIAAPEPGKPLVSGSVPVQHRIPRPVPLPPNEAKFPELALRTWASAFEPTKNLIAATSPVDEAFFAAVGTAPASRVQMRLDDPAEGTLPRTWDGRLVFRFTFAAAADAIADFTIDVEIALEGRTFAFSGPDKAADHVYRFQPKDADTDKALRAALQRQPAGAEVMVTARVAPRSAAAGSFQTLSFPLRLRDEARPALPLAPVFAHFEDPEYNRRLASSSRRAFATVKGSDGSKSAVNTASLAADREQYNADSVLFARYDWEGPTAAPLGTLSFRRVDTTGVTRVLRVVRGGTPVETVSLTAGSVFQASLLDLRQATSDRLPEFAPGETLELRIDAAPSGGTTVTVTLSLAIVAEPVVPAPDAAYALLRKQAAGAKTEVECVRFAWGPAATRIELVSAEDLRSDVVRRRAVFQLTDAFRVGRIQGYALQKITPLGEAHFPDVDVLDK